MLGKFEWIEILSELLPIKTRVVISGLFVACNIFLSAFFPDQYRKYVGIMVNIFVEQYQEEKMEVFTPLIDNFIESIKY